MGEGIEVEAKRDAKAVSVMRYIPDFKSTKWTLEIPTLTIALGAASVKFQTKLTEVTPPSSIVGPLPGQVETTKVRKADCEASFAAF